VSEYRKNLAGDKNVPCPQERVQGFEDVVNRAVIQYTKQELKDMFAAMDDEEKLLYGLFLNSGVRDAEMHAARSAEGVAQIPSQGQEQEEIRQGPIHSDSCKANLENQRQNETAQRSAT
jgi:hypothetical protein